MTTYNYREVRSKSWVNWHLGDGKRKCNQQREDKEKSASVKDTKGREVWSTLWPDVLHTEKRPSKHELKKKYKTTAFHNCLKGFLEGSNAMGLTEIALLWVKDSKEMERKTTDICDSEVGEEEARCGNFFCCC